MMPYLFFVLLAAGTVIGAEIPVLSANGDSEVILGTISTEAYTETLVATKLALDHQFLREMTLATEQGDAWKLDRFSIGLGISGEIGVGPYKFGTALKQRLLYTR